MLKHILNPDQERLLNRERQALADLLTALARLEVEAEDEQTLKRSINQLDELFLLVVVGEFNAGKSAFINALLGQTLLEEGVTPTTTRIQVLKHGSSGRRLLEKGLEEIQSANPLLSQLNIVDTPGANAIQREHEALTREFVPRSDMVLFVTSADRPFTESERVFLEGIRDWGKKIVVVINKIDILEKAEEVASVTAFVSENCRKLLGRSPEVFTVSSRQTLRRKIKESPDPADQSNRFSELESYIHQTLDEKERVRLKLLNPLGVGLRLSSKYLSAIASRLELLNADLSVLKDIEDQLQVYESDLNREFGFRLSDVDNVLHQFENRGVEFFDERMRLVRVFELLNKERLKSEYQRFVVADAPQRIEKRIDEVIDWMVASEFRQWQNVNEHLHRRRVQHGDRIIGEPSAGFEYDRSRLIDTVGKEAQRAVEGYDREKEANRMAEAVQFAVAGTALVEAGAIGLGTIVSLIATTTLADVTGILAAGAMAVLGLFVIPARRRQAKKDLKTRIEEMRTQLMAALQGQFERERQRSLSRINEAVSPYSRFVRAEHGKLDGSRQELASIQEKLNLLKAQIELI